MYYINFLRLLDPPFVSVKAAAHPSQHSAQPSVTAVFWAEEQCYC